MEHEIIPIEEEFPEVGEFIRQVVNNEEPHGITGCVIRKNQMIVQKNHTSWTSIDLLYNMKVGRNDPCSCGSKRKYKKCCGKGA